MANGNKMFYIEAGTFLIPFNCCSFFTLPSNLVSCDFCGDFETEGDTPFSDLVLPFSWAKKRNGKNFGKAVKSEKGSEAPKIRMTRHLCGIHLGYWISAWFTNWPIRTIYKWRIEKNLHRRHKLHTSAIEEWYVDATTGICDVYRWCVGDR